MLVTPTERVRANMKALLDRLVMTQREFAKRMGKSQPWVQKILDGENDLRLDDLDAAAAILNVPTAELVREIDDALIEVRPTELRIVREFRDLPPEVMMHVSELIHQLHKKAASGSLRNLKQTDVLEDTAAITRGIDASEAADSVSLAAQVAQFAAHLTKLSKRIATIEAGATSRRHAPSRRRKGTGNR